MSKIRTCAIRALDDQGIPYRLVMHDHRAMSVEEAAAERGVPINQVVKALLVRRSAEHRAPGWSHVMALVRGDQRLSLKKLARVTNVKRLEMAPPADVPRITGYQVGAVSPLGLRRTDVAIYVDQHIGEESQVSVSVGRHDAGLVLDTDDLIRAVAGQVTDITE
jgi:Cys-tRNA(Pro) deacylase